MPLHFGQKNVVCILHLLHNIQMRFRIHVRLPWKQTVYGPNHVCNIGYQSSLAGERADLMAFVINGRKRVYCPELFPAILGKGPWPKLRKNDLLT